MPDTLFFDLDGTLTDPAQGIVRSIQHACRESGRRVPAHDELLTCIGPPIHSTFATLLETDDPAVVAAAVQLYRSRYSTQGMLWENSVYPGVEAMLAQLCRAGKRLFVVTSKQDFAWSSRVRT